ncbi:DnaJ C-terminal domain-containing protein [Steroidobacter cummioxidans]|uniref:DnaJ C-terminal domain-containing protein n=1 Tax=Steroidobacter cummioxidans TaxID=1803913 RepID=UPI0019D44FB7|nr:DnaJ C-terminal domain-containing protein [Steroidobacter cummioxidans]
MPEYKDYYKIMGVARDAGQDELKRVYRRLARKYHPDVSKEKDAEARFKEVQEAYEVLKDPQKRAAYDQLGSNWRQGQEFRPPPDWGQNFEFSNAFGDQEGGFSDFFSSLFGGAARGGGRARGAGGRGFAMAGDDQVASIEIDLEDSFRGGTQTIELKSGPGATRKLKITIPQGIVEGQRIRLAGQGSPGHGGGPAGDLYLEVRFRKHKLYQVEGRDVTLTLPVAPWEAALGATVPTPTLAGPVDLRIPANAKAGQRMRLKGRGLPGATPGDQYVVLKIVLPPADTSQARELYERMQRELPFDPRAELQ